MSKQIKVTFYYVKVGFYLEHLMSMLWIVLNFFSQIPTFVFHWWSLREREREREICLCESKGERFLCVCERERERERYAECSGDQVEKQNKKWR